MPPQGKPGNLAHFGGESVLRPIAMRFSSVASKLPGALVMPASSDQKTAVVLCRASNSDQEALVAIRIEAMRESLERLGRFDPDRARAV